MKEILIEVLNFNDYDENFLELTLFAKLLENSAFKITEYDIGRIYTLAEIFFSITGKVNPYGELVGEIVGYDWEHHESKYNNVQF